MYFKYNTIEDVQRELKRRQEENAAFRDAWDAVKVNRKKDGAEFARIGQAVDGAKIGAYRYVEDAEHPYLTITAHVVSGGYISDHLPAFYYLDELPETDPRRAAYVCQFHRQTTPKTPEELRAAIRARVEMYTEKMNSYNEQIEKAPAVFKKYRDAITKATAELETASGKNGIFPTSLFYICSECR